MTCDRWHVTPETWHNVWDEYSFQILVPSVYQFGIECLWEIFWLKDDSVNESTNEIMTEVIVEQPQPYRVWNIYMRFHMPCVMCNLSCVVCQKSHVTKNRSHVTNIKNRNHGPHPVTSPQYKQQDGSQWPNNNFFLCGHF